MKQDDPQFKLRLKPELKERLEESAKANTRTLGAEIVARLEDSYQGGDAAELQLHISRLQGELAGAKFVTDSLMEDASAQLGKMSRARANARLLAIRLAELFDDMSGLAQEYIDGDVRDPQLAAAKFELLLSQKADAEEALDTGDPEDERPSVQRIAEGASRLKRKPRAKVLSVGARQQKKPAK